MAHFKTFPNTGPCFDFPCPTVAHVCDVFNETTAECKCPKFDPLEHDKVCGYVTWTHNGTVPKTWRNPGQLKRYACMHDAVDYTVMNTGDCGGKNKHNGLVSITLCMLGNVACFCRLLGFFLSK